jgi:asparagine synthase (glutamine-hydrolysing)
MSVQAGIWNFDGQPIDRDLLSKIGSATSRYAPDGESLHVDGNLAMLYRPFHTTPESRLETQPHMSRHGLVITWDGRLDNRDELISDLRHYMVDERTDVSIVAAAFERWGTDCFQKIRGDWALSIWNSSDRELLLARDYVGTRQLYYHRRSRGIAWCNHLAPLALCGPSFGLSSEYVAGYIVSRDSTDLTPFNEIYSVKPAHYIRIGPDQITTHVYWTFNPRSQTRYRTDAEYEEQFRVLFRQSIRRRLRTDSPALAELSGGRDSSSIVCMADDILQKEGADTPRLDTLSGLNRDEPGDDDFVYVAKMEKKRGRKGHGKEIRCFGDAFCLDYPDFVAIPGFGLRQEFSRLVSEVLATGQFRVVFSGLGGDELLGQGFDCRVQLADFLSRLRLKSLSSELLKWSLELRQPWIQLFLGAASLTMPDWLRRKGSRRKMIPPWINRTFARRSGFCDHLQSADGPLHWLPSERDRLHTYGTLTALMMRVRPSREDRVYPYLDQPLVEFLLSIPADQLFRPGERRSLMKRALVGLVPDEILQRKTKGSSVRSLSVTLEKHWQRIETILESPMIFDLGYVKKQPFREALLDLKSGQLSPHVPSLLKALSLEVWLRDAVDRGIVAISMRQGNRQSRLRSVSELKAVS